jgi:hypothetical protein
MWTLCVAVMGLCLTVVQEDLTPAQQVAAVKNALEKERQDYIDKLNKATSSDCG